MPLKMNTFIRLIPIFFSLFVSVAGVAAPDQKFNEMKLIDSRGKPALLETLIDKKKHALLAIVSISTGCPMIQKSFIKYERLSKKWGNDKVKFIYLDSSPKFKIRATLSEVKKFNSGIAVYFDETQQFTKAIGLQSTNQIVLIDVVKSQVVYIGAVDNSLNYYTQKAEKTEFAENAMEQFFNNKIIDPAKTDAFGCAITFKRP